MYVDEAGDPGVPSGGGTPWFVLSAYVLHEMKWQEKLNEHVEFRRYLRDKYNFPLKLEFHTGELIRTQKLSSHPLNVRMSMVRDYTKFISNLDGILILNVAIDKVKLEAQGDGARCFEHAWNFLIQRFENTIISHNFPSPRNNYNHSPGNRLGKVLNADDRGSLICDATNEGGVIRVMRKMRVHNPIPMKRSIATGTFHIPATHLVEDPSFKASKNSLLVQTADVITFNTYQMLRPNKHVKRHNGHKLFPILMPRITTGGPLPTRIVIYPK